MSSRTSVSRRVESAIDYTEAPTGTVTCSSADGVGPSQEECRGRIARLQPFARLLDHEERVGPGLGQQMPRNLRARGGGPPGAVAPHEHGADEIGAPAPGLDGLR